MASDIAHTARTAERTAREEEYNEGGPSPLGGTRAMTAGVSDGEMPAYGIGVPLLWVSTNTESTRGPPHREWARP